MGKSPSSQINWTQMISNTIYIHCYKISQAHIICPHSQNSQGSNAIRVSHRCRLLCNTAGSVVRRQTLLIAWLSVAALGLRAAGALVDDVIAADGLLVVALCSRGSVSRSSKNTNNPRICGSPSCSSLSADLESTPLSILVSSETTPTPPFWPGRLT